MARQKVPGTDINKPIKAETNLPNKSKMTPEKVAEQQNLLKKLKTPSSKKVKKGAMTKKANTNNPNRKPKNG
jgi:hypothetical protein